METELSLLDWCSNGINNITFQTSAEYRVLQQVLSCLEGSKVALIHAKDITLDLSDEIVLIDATGHALTAKTALRRRISDSDDERFIENPADIQGFLSRIRRLKKSHKDVEWWLWWSPSDLIAHGVNEEEISQVLRVISSDFADTRFVAFIAREIHDTKGLSLFDYISNVSISVERVHESGKTRYHWQVEKHPDTKMEGVMIEY